MVQDKFHGFGVVILSIVVLIALSMFIMGATYPPQQRAVEDTFFEAENAYDFSGVTLTGAYGESAVKFYLDNTYIQKSSDDITLKEDVNYVIWARQAKSEGSNKGTIVYISNNGNLERISNEIVNEEANEWEWIRYNRMSGSDFKFKGDELMGDGLAFGTEGNMKGFVYLDKVLITEDETYDPNTAKEVEVLDVIIDYSSMNDGRIKMTCVADENVNTMFPYHDFEAYSQYFAGMEKINNKWYYNYEFKVNPSLNGEYEIACYFTNNIYGTDVSKEMPYPKTFIVNKTVNIPVISDLEYTGVANKIKSFSLDSTNIKGDVIESEDGSGNFHVKTIIPSEEEMNLVNGFELAEGKYIAKISSGAWRRWYEGTDNSQWGGAVGLVWESSANVAYRDGGELIKTRIGNLFFYDEESAEKFSVGDGVVFNHEGGKAYIYLDDSYLVDNYGTVVVDLYKISESGDSENSDLVLSYVDVPSKIDSGDDFEVDVGVILYGETSLVTDLVIKVDGGVVLRINDHPLNLGNNNIKVNLNNDFSIGTHEIEVIIDPDNKIQEENEDDNSLSSTFEIVRSGGSGGGSSSSGSSSSGKDLISSNSQWECSGWSLCVDEVQTRVCTDLNNLYNTIDKPEETRMCGEGSVKILNLSEDKEDGLKNNYFYWILGTLFLLILILLILIFLL
jgi:hypothetical protein